MHSLTHAYIERENKIVRRAQVDGALARFNDELTGQLAFEPVDLTTERAVAFSWNWNSESDGIYITMLYNKLPPSDGWVGPHGWCPVANKIHDSLSMIFPDIAVNMSGVAIFTEKTEEHFAALAEREIIAAAIKTRL